MSEHEKKLLEQMIELYKKLSREDQHEVLGYTRAKAGE